MPTARPHTDLLALVYEELRAWWKYQIDTDGVFASIVGEVVFPPPTGQPACCLLTLRARLRAPHSSMCGGKMLACLGLAYFAH
jgi:hypothetical protein